MSEIHGDKEVERALTDQQILFMRKQNMSHEQIAVALGVERSTISKRIKRIYAQMADEASGLETRAREVERVDKMIERLLPALMPETNDDGQTPLPSPKAIDSYLKLARFKSELTGAYAPKQVDHRIGFDFMGDNDESAEKAADMVNTYMELMDKVASAGYGSGRAPEDIVDAEVVEEEVVELMPGDGEDDWVESEEEVGPLPVGEWVNGKFIPRVDDDGGETPPSWTV